MSTSASSGGGQKKAVDTSPSQTTHKGSNSACTSILKDLLLSKKVKMSLPLHSPVSPPSGHDKLDTEAKQSPDVVPESSNELDSDLDRPSPLPNQKKYLRRSERSRVPYWIDESPPPEDTVHKIKDSSCLPHLESLLDTNFRRLSGKSAQKSRPQKRVLPVKSSGSASAHDALISPEVLECPMTKKGEKLSELDDKSAERGSSSSPLTSPLFDENAPLIASVFEKVAKSLSSSNLESMRRTKSNETTCGITQDKPHNMPTKSSSAEPPNSCASTNFELVPSCGEEPLKSDPFHLPSLLSTVEEEASAARTSISATAAALKRRKSDESAKTSNGQGSTGCGIPKEVSSSSNILTKKSRSAPPGDIYVVPRTKKPRLSSAELDKHDGDLPSESRERTDHSEQERTRKCRSTSPIRVPKRERTLTITLKGVMDSQISQTNLNLAQSRNSGAVKSTSSSGTGEAGDLESLNETEVPKSKRTKVDHSKHSDDDKRSPPSDLTLQGSVLRSPAKLADKKSPTKPARSPPSDQRRESSSRSSVGRSRALSAPSCTESELVNRDCERERELLTSHRHSSSNSREASPSRYRSLSPLSHHREPEYYCHSSHPPPPPPPPSHDIRHRRLPLLGEAPFPHPVMAHLSSPYRGQPRYPPIVSPPPYYHSFPLPPPHLRWSHHVSPYGPPPHFPLDRNPYDQRNYRSSVSQRHGCQTVPPHEWYCNNLL